MKLKTLAIAVAALALLAGIGLLAKWKLGAPAAAGRVGQPLMGALDMTQAARIELVGPASRTTLIAQPAGWTVQEQGGFPADQGKLNTFLLKLAEQKIADTVSDNPADFGDLGVLTVAENGNKAEERKTGTLFRILDGSGKPLYQLLIGRDRSQSMTVSAYGGQYVRFPQDKAALLIGTTLYAETDPKEWLDKAILPAEAEKNFRSIRVERPGAKLLTFSRKQADSPWEMDGGTPRGLNAQEIDNLSKKLRDLQVGQIAPAGGTPASLGRAKLGVVEAHTFDGRTWRLDVGELKGADNYRYATVRETLDGSVSDAAQKKQAEAFNEKFKGRVFGIPDWDASRLFHERKEYLQSK